jgi:hypothetical protein
MRGGARSAYTHMLHHVKTLVVTSSRPNPETLAACELLAHLRVTFHPCMCGLRGGTVAFVVMLISYNDVRRYCRDDHVEEMIVIDYFLYTDA